MQNQISPIRVFIYVSDRKPTASLSYLAATEEILDIINYLHIISELHSEEVVTFNPGHAGCVLLKLLLKTFSSGLWL